MTTTASHRLRRFALVAAAIGTVAASSIATGSVDAREKDDGSEGSKTDIELIAKTFDWDVEATAKHIDNQHTFGRLINTLATKYKKKFAGAEFSERPGEPAHIMIKGRAWLTIVRLVEESGLDVKIVDGFEENERQLTRRADKVMRAFMEAGYPEVSAATFPNGEIKIAFAGKAKGEPKLDERLLKNVEIVEGPEKMINNEVDVKGGIQILGGGFQCTSGFSVRSITTGERGIATAAHCNGMTTYNPPGPNETLSFRAQHLSGLGDLEWHATTGNEIDNYIAGPAITDERDVSTVWPANGFANNMVTCVHSRMQAERSCDRIYSTNVSSGLFGTGVGSLIAMDNDNTVGGDSGGPWSFGTIADGIHRGDQWIWFGTRNVFSRAALLPAAVGARVMV